MNKQEIKDNISQLIAAELTRSYGQFPAFSSPHEGYSVIKEEVEEAGADFGQVCIAMAKLWEAVKKNEDAYFMADDIKINAYKLVYESIQVAAMAQKYIESMIKIKKAKVPSSTNERNREETDAQCQQL